MWDRKQKDAALQRAYNLYLHAELPPVIRANCCSLLSTGESEYLRFAQEAVELYTEMIKMEPGHSGLLELLQSAQMLLKRAERDTATQGKCTVIRA